MDITCYMDGGGWWRRKFWVDLCGGGGHPDTIVISLVFKIWSFLYDCFFFFLLCISYFHFWLLMLKSVSSLLSSFPTLFFSYQTSYTGTLANTFIPCAWNVIPSGYLLVGSSLSAQMFPPQKFDYYVGSPSPVALHCIPVVFSFFPALITI